ALYPASENHTYTAGANPTFYVQPEVDFTKTGFSANIPMYALSAAEGEFSFKNLASTYKFTLKNLASNVNKVKFVVYNQTTHALSGSWPINTGEIFINYDYATPGSAKSKLTYINSVTNGQAVFYVSCRYWGQFQPHITISDAESDVVLREFVAGSANQPTYLNKVQPIALDMGMLQAAITAGDVVVKAGKTASIIASTNSTAAIEYVSANPEIATVSSTGAVTGVSVGTTTITLSVPAVEGKYTAASKTINVTVIEATNNTIDIDGDFSDWSSLQAGTFYKVVNNPGSLWGGVKEMRVYATAETVNYYVKFDQDALQEAKNAATPTMNMQINLNTDGEFTSGYSGPFLDKYDFMIEGSIMTNGNFKDFNGRLYQRINGSWGSSLGSGMTSGAGSGIEYEFSLDRAKFNTAANTSSDPMSMGDEFQTGLSLLWNGWTTFSNIPNASGGNGHLLNVQTGGGTVPGDVYELAAPEVKDGDTILATNANVNNFLTNVSYPTHDCSFTSLLTWAETNNVAVCPGDSDRPQEYSIRWTPYTSTSDATITVSEPTRNWVYTTSVENGYVNISNLLPNTHYTYTVTADGNTLTQGAFDTVGKVHQLLIRSAIRNCRDLGGWTTTNGKTVKYRKVYRGGRLEPSYLDSEGKAVLKTEGIKAQLDLRGQSDVLSQCTLKGIVDDYAFCAPVVEEGYRTMLRDDKEKTRQCIQFIMDCVAADKPVYFHCSLGRDRTGTVAMLVLGILGVPEGDISQEYELTQFAPVGYATSTGESQYMTRMANWGYGYTADYIWDEYANGGSFQDGVNAYLLEIGITQADIDQFKQNMLQ
ncbi:MAG: tyrosine-protein phosphatase, partial [Bacteroidales bacterium]|nr:tyrosine-protein phosphatase [Bacteroidales bacterium]